MSNLQEPDLASPFSAYLALASQLLRFGIVGLSAAIIHFSVVALLVERANLAPLVANIFGFLVSFPLSYWGHRFWTFQDTEAQHKVAVAKLLLIQLVNFSANESLFYIFLSLHLPYLLALAIVLIILPIFTFASSKLWAFR